MAAPSAWIVYNDFRLNLGKKLVDMANDSFRIALFQSTSNAVSAVATPAAYDSFSHEVDDGNGYSTGGVLAALQTWTGGGGTPASTFDVANVSWTASGIGFSARAAVLYDDSATPKVAVAYMLLDSAPADVDVSTGNMLTIEISNLFALT